MGDECVDAMRRGAADGTVRPDRWGGDGTMSTPLYQLKAEFFKTLGHPARIRVLELLSEREHAVAEMLPEVGIEPAHLSQQLAVLRRANLVVTRKEGSTVHYSLTSPHVAELLRVARTILSGVLAGQAELLADLQATQGEPERRASR
ncbi:metalloregulator ArsR/SmtB family transcription factor [Streptomyces thermospinosisporus]|uniref:Metalloregulator ArsR/SmtB family transcription factor n=2 Tax=Streptomyces thermospinosisporus TaxID=161482 RepID=A0ABP4K0S1_9ACTN